MKKSKQSKLPQRRADAAAGPAAAADSTATVMASLADRNFTDRELVIWRKLQKELMVRKSPQGILTILMGQSPDVAARLLNCRFQNSETFVMRCVDLIFNQDTQGTAQELFALMKYILTAGNGVNLWKKDKDDKYLLTRFSLAVLEVVGEKRVFGTYDCEQRGRWVSETFDLIQACMHRDLGRVAPIQCSWTCDFGLDGILYVDLIQGQDAAGNILKVRVIPLIRNERPSFEGLHVPLTIPVFTGASVALDPVLAECQMFLFQNGLPRSNFGVGSRSPSETVLKISFAYLDAESRVIFHDCVPSARNELIIIVPCVLIGDESPFRISVQDSEAFSAFRRELTAFFTEMNTEELTLDGLLEQMRLEDAGLNSTPSPSKF